jgi:hypothetical protein
MFSKALEDYAATISAGAEDIAPERQALLRPIVSYLADVISKQQEPRLLFVCTQNSRRSIFAEVWAQVAAWKYGISNFHASSAGSAVTTLHPNTRDALMRSGILIEANGGGENPLYRAEFGHALPPMNLFSKDLDHPGLPKKNFGAVLVCVNDAEACPFIPNADVRIPLPYADPKKFDGTDEVKMAYDHSCEEIAREMFWVMKQVSEKMPR